MPHAPPHYFLISNLYNQSELGLLCLHLDKKRKTMHIDQNNQKDKRPNQEEQYRKKEEEKKKRDKEVDEQSEQSFPASDPPSYSKPPTEE